MSCEWGFQVHSLALWGCDLKVEYRIHTAERKAQNMNLNEISIKLRIYSRGLKLAAQEPFAISTITFYGPLYLTSEFNFSAATTFFCSGVLYLWAAITEAHYSFRWNVILKCHRVEGQDIMLLIPSHVFFKTCREEKLRQREQLIQPSIHFRIRWPSKA